MRSRYSLTSWSFKSAPKDDLIEGPTIRVTGRDEPENSYGEIGDLAVDRLLLRDLLSYVNNTRHNTLIPTHLIVADGILEFLDDCRHLFGILALIRKPSRSPFRLQPLQSLLDRFQPAERPSIGADGMNNGCAYLDNSERRFFSP